MGIKIELPYRMEIKDSKDLVIYVRPMMSEKYQKHKAKEEINGIISKYGIQEILKLLSERVGEYDES